MSVYLASDTGPGTHVASNKGWRDVGDWIAQLDDAPELSHLYECGWNEPASAIRNELKTAMKRLPAKPSVSTTLHGLAEALVDLDDNDPVVITNGTQNAGDD